MNVIDNYMFNELTMQKNRENAKNEDLRAVRTMMNEIKSNSEIAEKLQIGEDEVRMIIKVSKDYNIEELDSNRKL